MVKRKVMGVSAPPPRPTRTALALLVVLAAPGVVALGRLIDPVLRAALGLG